MSLRPRFCPRGLGCLRRLNDIGNGILAIKPSDVGDRQIAADKACEKLRMWTFIDPAVPGEIVPLERVSTMLSDTIPGFPGAIAALWLSGVRDREKEAHAAAAMLFAEALSGLEVLSETSILHFDAQRVIFPELNAPAYAFGPAWP